jgi:hypothetical protein
MADFQFTVRDFEVDSSTTKDFSTENLETIIREFNYFLKGAGFEFHGAIGLIDDEDEVLNG